MLGPMNPYVYETLRQERERELARHLLRADARRRQRDRREATATTPPHDHVLRWLCRLLDDAATGDTDHLVPLIEMRVRQLHGDPPRRRRLGAWLPTRRNAWDSA
jgi:hypothetical protein